MNFLTEIWGAPGVGKTHLGHKLAGDGNALHIDTATTANSVQEKEVKVRSDREFGESWPVVQSIYGYDEEAASSHYWFADSLQSVRMAVDADGGEHDAVVLDNTTDLRNLAIKEFLGECDQTWIMQEQYGAVNDKVDALTDWILAQGYHVVWITQMTDEYVNGQSTGEKVPKSPKYGDHRCDFRLEVAVEGTDDAKERIIRVRKNRHADPIGGGPAAEGSEHTGSLTLDTLLALSDVPGEVA